MHPPPDAPDAPDAVDCVVVGAGVVGLACAFALARAGREVWVVDAAATHGCVTSARSSEVIHAGLYYPAGSLRARLCVRGRELLLAHCERHRVPHRLCGKLVVAASADEAARLDEIATRARDCGAPPLQPWSRAQVRAAEPALRVHSALWLPGTGIVDSAALMASLRTLAEQAGARFVFRTPVSALRFDPDGTAAPLVLALGGADPVRLRARAVVNAAGHGAVALARQASGLPASYQARLPQAFHARGAYFELAGRAPFSRLVYPVPGDSTHLGIHLTLDLAGRARFGPDFSWCDGLDTTVDAADAPRFAQAIRRYWPGLPDGTLKPAFAGVRPKITGPGEPAADFRIDGPAEHGVPGLVHLLGIESPGLTAALAIGELVAALGV